MDVYTTPNLHKKPSSLRYYQEGVPTIDIQSWRLEIVTLGSGRATLTYTDLLQLPQTTQHRRFVCVCNWSIKRFWQGVLLRDVLQAANINPDSLSGKFIRQISAGTPEKGVYESWIDAHAAVQHGALLAHAVDGAPLPPEQGYPLRLVDFGLYGYKSVKGLRHIEITDEAKLGHWEKLAGYALDGTIRPKRYWSVDLRKHMFASTPGEVTEW